MKMMLDKALHFLGGATFAIPSKYSVSMALVAGVGVEVFGMITQTGRFDYWDIIATMLGGVVVFLWKMKGEGKHI